MSGHDDTPNGIRQVPAGIRDRILEIGDTFDETLVDAMERLYSPLLVERDRSTISVTKDIPYGSHERQVLDVHAADGGGDGLTSVLFFHGGGFVRGHKNMAGDTFYGNVANYFARHSMIGVNATYRLAPDHKWPTGADDVGAALGWARDNISAFGGDPNRILIMGQSAGATHVATYAFRSDIHGAGGPGCAGIILMSGIYHLGDGPIAPNYLAYYGERAADYAGKMVQGNIDWAGCPVFICIAEFDPSQFQQSGISLMNELASVHRNTPRLKMLLGHNHISQVMHIDTDDETFGAEAVDFIRTCVEG
ncbi:MAG: hypothetical protein CBD27_11780 [Rhodospirillaceae bacterium TMED167]|nr:hypothetical protein [Rhodospirillaceae bacterium]OUW23879.1 MAG: hypothetical protein CBD27_11780 [Rhodospirillaceae bacterium TMED167]